VVRPWTIVERVATEAGPLELRRRGAGDFLITIDGRVLMNSAARRSEEALARIACAGLADRPRVRVLIGGLGMGFTLRAALDALPGDARVVVAELHAAVVAWCRGPLAPVAGDPLGDPRVRVVCGDVAAVIAGSAGDPASDRFDVILLDLYEGPGAAACSGGEAFYGSRALATTRRALAPGGCFAVWSEDPDPAFERRLRRAGFAVATHRPGRGGRRHAVTVGRAPVYDAG
jgi:spermidine synthase